MEMKTITLNNGVRFIVIKGNRIPILVDHLNLLSILASIADTTKNDLDKANYINASCLISDFNNLQRQDRLLR